MDSFVHENTATCRFCLCKCETVRNLLEEINFATKIRELFPKVVISSENGLSKLICDYCYNKIQEFLEYYENVNANQAELMKFQLSQPVKEEIFAEPIYHFDQKRFESDSEDNDSFTFDKQELFDESSNDKVFQKVQIPTSTNFPYTKDELSKMNFFELKKLPVNFRTFYKCHLCSLNNKRYKIISDLKYHIARDHIPEISKQKLRLKKAESYLKNLNGFCEICEKVIPYVKNSNKFKEHKFAHYDIKPYKCDICGFSTTEKRFISAHIFAKHKIKLKNLGCIVCKQTFESRVLRNEHMLQCHPENIQSCMTCDIKFFDEQSFKLHLKIGRCRFEFQIECPRCPGGIRFPDEKVFGLHMQRHDYEDGFQRLFRCHLCERGFDKENVFQTHLGYHTENVLVPCEICGKTVFHDSVLKVPKHMVVHKEKKTEIYTCDICGAGCKSKQLLAKHFNRVHNRIEETCYKCGKMRSTYGMKRHLKNCHAGDLKCAHCPEMFKTKNQRNQHTARVHTGFHCRRCNMSFQSHYQLKRHRVKDEIHLLSKKNRT